NEEKFKSINVKLLQPEPELVDISFNKFKFYKTVTTLGFQSQKSYINIDTVINLLSSKELSFPLFLKPNSGSASLNINKVEGKDLLLSLYNNHDDLIIQEFINGKEYGI